MAIALIVSPSLIYSVLLLTDGYNSQTIAAQHRAELPDRDRPAALRAHRHRSDAVRHLAGVNMFARYIIGANGPRRQGRKKGKRS